MDNNQLTITSNESFEQFLLKLNQATGFSSGMPTFPLLKFDGETGVWKEETQEKDADGKSIYKDIAESIEMHIITTRKMVQSKFEVAPKLYSREFQDNFVELFDETGKVVLSGAYQALKNAEPTLVFVQVLYAFVGDKVYRVKLSGSKLTNLFPYLSSFKNDNPALWMTTASRGQKKKKGAIEYYELNFTKGTRLENEIIVKRVNDINQYLTLYAQARAQKKNIQPAEPTEQYVPDNAQTAPVEDDEINVSNIQF